MVGAGHTTIYFVLFNAAVSNPNPYHRMVVLLVNSEVESETKKLWTDLSCCRRIHQDD
jgi:hypothetical protein